MGHELQGYAGAAMAVWVCLRVGDDDFECGIAVDLV
jgi:hypothetical protein